MSGRRETDAFEPTGFPGYTMQMLAHPESATFINSRVAAGGHAADRHIHDADQLYFVVEGEMQVELGDACIRPLPGAWCTSQRDSRTGTGMRARAGNSTLR